MAIESDPKDEGFRILSKTLAANVGDMDDKKASRALLYLNEFERSGAQLTFDKLGDSFQVLVKSNEARSKSFEISFKVVTLHFIFSLL